MTGRFRITLAQLNPTVGDITGNAAKAREAWEQGRVAGADLVALTEMFITGYNAQDLVMKEAFTRHAMAAIDDLREACAEGPALAIGGPLLQGGKLYNAYHVLKGGRLVR
ncbi:MAG: nitrilase-related carbon-nitrogen hydrolase, partial [Pseudomonadota bacterium]